MQQQNILNNRSNILLININKLGYELKMVGLIKTQNLNGIMILGFYKDRLIYLDTRAVLKRESPVRWMG